MVLGWLTQKQLVYSQRLLGRAYRTDLMIFHQFVGGESSAHSNTKRNAELKGV
jgi:hypothetical protein